MTYEIATVLCGHQKPDWPDKANWDRSRIISIDNSANESSPCECYQTALEWCTSDVLMYMHSDLTIHENWDDRVMALFDNPKCVAVGLGGATALGHPDLYKKPYNIWNMARRGYASNQTDWGVHGSKETGVRRVVVLDAFFMAVRTGWLRSIGGWPVEHLTFHCMDLWLACMAARDKRETWMVGVSVTHHGGGTSTKDSYQHAKWLQGGDTIRDHQDPHVWLANEFRDVLPFHV